MPKKLAFIGTGQIASAHLHGVMEWNRAASQDEQLEIAALIDLVPGRAREFCDQHVLKAGLPEPAMVGQDYRRLLDAPHRPDLASVLLPHHLHLDVGRDLLNAGVALQMQKPLGLGIRDGHELIGISRASGTPLVVSEPAVLGRLSRLMIEWVRSGRQIGEPTLLIDQAVIDLQGTFFMTPWRHLKGMAGAGWFIDHGVHRTHWMLEALGQCESVFAFTRQIEPTRRNERWGAVEVDTEDLACAVLRFRSGAVAQWSVVSGGRGEGLGLVRLWGTRGSLNGNVVRLSGEEQPAALEFPEDLVPAAIPGNPFAHSYMELLDRMRDPGSPVVSSAERALEAEAIVYACLESAHTGAPVAVADIVSERVHAYEDTVWAARGKAAAMDMTRLT
jgi:predicted dehydrogenase